MKCREYREAIAADPSGAGGDAAAHAAICGGCSRFGEEMRALDSSIAAALAVDVPPLRLPALPAIDPAESVKVDRPARRPGRAMTLAWLGLAASLAAAAFLGVRFISPGPEAPSLASQIVAHMDHEQPSRWVASVAVSERALANVIGSEVSALEAGGALVTYARTCVINGKPVPHLVIQGESGPVTLILMADESIDAAVPLSGENVHGVIVPVGNGSVAIIGEQAEQLGEIDAIRQRLVESMRWRL